MMGRIAGELKSRGVDYLMFEHLTGVCKLHLAHYSNYGLCSALVNAVKRMHPVAKRDPRSVAYHAQCRHSTSKVSMIWTEVHTLWPYVLMVANFWACY